MVIEVDIRFDLHVDVHGSTSALRALLSQAIVLSGAVDFGQRHCGVLEGKNKVIRAIDIGHPAIRCQGRGAQSNIIATSV
jgi:hypothetical protein